MLPVSAFYLLEGEDCFGFYLSLNFFYSSDKKLGLPNAAVQHALKKERVMVLLTVRPCYCFIAQPWACPQ